MAAFDTVCEDCSFNILNFLHMCGLIMSYDCASHAHRNRYVAPTASCPGIRSRSSAAFDRSFYQMLLSNASLHLDLIP